MKLAWLVWQDDSHIVVPEYVAAVAVPIVQPGHNRVSSFDNQSLCVNFSDSRFTSDGCLRSC